MTAFYMFRLYPTTFMGTFRRSEEQKNHLHESPSAITIPLIVLAVLSIIGGFVNIPEVFGGEEQLHKFLSPVLQSETAHALSNSTEYALMGISVVVAAIAIFIAIGKYSKKPELGEPQGFGKVLANKWYVDELYDSLIVNPLNYLAGFFKNVIERSGIDGFVNGVGTFIQYSSRRLRLVQNGRVGTYILLMVFSVLLLWLVFWWEGQIIGFFQKIF